MSRWHRVGKCVENWVQSGVKKKGGGKSVTQYSGGRTGHPRKPSGLLVPGLAHPGDLQQLVPPAEPAVLVAVGDGRRCNFGSEPGDPLQKKVEKG